MKLYSRLLAGLIAFMPVLPVAAAPPVPIRSLDPIGVGPELLVHATFPAAGLEPLPVVILSHGDRLSRNDYRPLVEAWARAGLLVLQPDHADASIDGFPPAQRLPDMWKRRIADIEQLLDGLAAIELGTGRKIDRKRIAIAGHSLGGLVAEALVGARIPDPATGILGSFADPRLKAALLLAPPGSADDLVPEWKLRAPYLAVDFAAMREPLLEIAGGNDEGTMSNAGAGWRMQAYRKASPGGKCLIVVSGAGHYLGGINGPYQPPVDADPIRIALVRDASTAFLLSALYVENPAWHDFLSKPRSAAAAEIACK